MYRNSIIISTIFLFLFQVCNSQNSIIGEFSAIKNQVIKLFEYDKFKINLVDSAVADENGKFSLAYSNEHNGMGYIIDENNRSYLVVLNDKTLKIKGIDFLQHDNLIILEGDENKIFNLYASDYLTREKVLSALYYLEKLYSGEQILSKHFNMKGLINNEIIFINSEDSLFLSNLDDLYFLRTYLPLRKLISSVNAVAQYRTKEIWNTIEKFRNVDFTNIYIKKSGLYEDIIKSHFWLIENCGKDLDSIHIEINKSIDISIQSISMDSLLFNDISQFLFNYLENRSLFNSSEYFAIKLLNNYESKLNSNFKEQLEKYRSMKIGNYVPDVSFNGEIIVPELYNNVKPEKLSKLKNELTVFYFGSSWCSHCPNELLKLAELYKVWKDKMIEVVFVSLDEDLKTFQKFVKVFPFISVCDFQKWESPIVKSFHVYSTPSIYLVDKKQKILLVPNSISQLELWINSNLQTD